MSSDGSPALLPNASAYGQPALPNVLRTQVLRFVCVGGASVLLDLAAYMLLCGVLDRASAKGISYLCGMLLGFVGNKYWTFSSRSRSVSEPVTYVVLYALTLGVNVLLNSGSLVLIRGFCESEQAAQLWAFFIATGTTTVLNFAGMKYVAFRQRQA
jgi:putative flippase GtrA